MTLRALFIIGLLGAAAPTLAEPLAPADVPAPLRPWVGWVLQDGPELECPFRYHDHAARRCAWPSYLGLELVEGGGHFNGIWHVLSDEWITLPGDVQAWPQDVTVGGEPARVSERGGRPVLELAAGTYLIRGELHWDRLPESVAVPGDSGLVGVSVNGTPIEKPDIDPAGRLWLQARDTGTRTTVVEADTLTLRVFRQIIDEIPLAVVTRVDITVSGAPREVLLGQALLDGFIPTSLASPLPARLEPDGRLRVQVRPGNWTVLVTARHPSELVALALGASPPPWADEEIWTFDARNDLRLVEVEGVPLIDPRQTTLPPEWLHLPAYRVRPGEAMQFKLIRRGDPEPEPDQLHLERSLWLDFAGTGYTANDAVTGRMTRGWRLEAGERLDLGRVALDGEAQFITLRPGAARPGVELRRGAERLDAASRLEGAIRRIPAVGWDQDFHSLRATLNLPPGWTLLSASGVDDATDTWVERWTLLDLFFVLIVSFGVARLWSWPMGALALVTLGLLWHEPGAPQYVWLHLLVAIALLRVLPVGRLQIFVRWYKTGAMVALALIALPFAVDLIRTALYPQLERPGGTMEARLAEAPAMAVGGVDPSKVEAVTEAEEMAVEELLSKDALTSLPVVPAEPERRLDEIDPNARIQTGPGVPDWRWNVIPLVWNGPVLRDQEVSLVLLSPRVNLVLDLARIALLLWLAGAILGVRSWPSAATPKANAPLAGVLGALGIGFALLLAARPAGAEVGTNGFPGESLLQELRARLLAPPECLPSCAQIPRAHLEVADDQLVLRLEVVATEDVAVPLPAHPRHWMPSQVLVDEAAAQGLFRTPEDEIWLLVTAGVHEVVLSGRVAGRTVQLPLPLRPYRVEVDAEGWRIDGLRENGIPDTQLVLTRIEATQSSATDVALEPSNLPPFARVTRTLHIGLEWRVQTVVKRAAETGVAVVLELPLLDGESVTSPGIEVRGGKVQVNLPPQQPVLRWESTLEKAEQLTLTAADTSGWVEVWRADVSPVWHLEASGIPVVHHQDPGGTWLPEWRPWPGERVDLRLSRPAGVAGATLTIDSSRLHVTGGQRATDTTLELSLRSSQGGQHTLRLPKGALLESVIIDGAVLPIRQEGAEVTLPLSPGTRVVSLGFREAEGVGRSFRSPDVNLGVPSVNSRIHLSLGTDRWVLFTSGPRLGPAVLFWGVLIVIVIVAVLLGRIRLTPLRTRDWVLLGVGLMQSPLFNGAVVVAWLFALGLRARLSQHVGTSRFNLAQIALAILTLVSFYMLIDTIQWGLLGPPQMQISGNGSTASELRWYQDRAGADLPRATVISAPLWTYRVLMLAWALWLAFALLGWIRWGWGCFTTHGLWRRFRLFGRRPPLASPSEQV